MEKFLSLFALTSSPYGEEIKVRLLDLLYSNFFKSAYVMIVVASFLLYVLWSYVPHETILIWYVAITMLTIFRLIDARLYIKDKEKNTFSYWYQHFAFGVVLSALLWGLVPLLFMSDTDLQVNFFIAFVIFGMSAGAITTLAADLRLSHIYLYAILLPLIYTFWRSDNPFFAVITILIFLYFIIVSSATRQFHATLIDTYETKDLYDTAREELLENEKRLRMMFDQAPIGVFYYDDDMNIVDCNKELASIMHVSKEQLIGINLNNLPDSRPMDAMRPSLEAGIPTQYEGPYTSKIAKLDLSVKIQMTPLVDANGNSEGGLCMMEDKTKEHAMRKEAEFLSLHDPLTGLPNRKLLKELMSQLLSEQERNHAHSALLFLDLDHFKQINDSLGHAVGDNILIATADRLSHTLRKSDTLSRLGGDEFVILLPEISHDEESALRHAYEVAQKIHDVMGEAFSIDANLLFTSTSIGISIFNAENEESDEILRRADMAMYQSKAAGRKRTSFYDPEMDRQMQSYIEMKKNLRHAIKEEEFSLYFQPILTIDTNRVVAAETLLRWHHDGAFIPTDKLIAVAEESSLINEIGDWVIQETCRQIQRWQNSDQFALDYVTINISTRQLLEKGFADYMLETMHQYSIAHSLVKLEITETALITNFDKAKEIIGRLNASGIDFIIDDFGTGYSSLSYLKRLPFTALKIDKSFVQDILDDPEDEKLIRAIIHTAEQFNYQIVAEGIEEEPQRRLLEEIKPTLYYQGYLASRPLPVEAFQSYLAKA